MFKKIFKATGANASTIEPIITHSRFYRLDNGVPVRVDYNQKDEPFAAWKVMRGPSNIAIVANDLEILNDTLSKGTEVTSEAYTSLLRKFMDRINQSQPLPPAA